ncbi:MAG: NUDIX hydrolase [Bryobacteraceae bacterium]
MTRSDNRRYPARPILGVGALILDGRRVLLVQRGNEPLRGCWSLPGGGVESGERLEDALVREVYEETNLRVQTGPIATVFERLMPDASGACEYHYVLIDFYCTIAGGDLLAGSDSAGAEWFDIDALGALPMTAGTREVIASCRASGCATHPFVTRP